MTITITPEDLRSIIVQSQEVQNNRLRYCLEGAFLRRSDLTLRGEEIVHRLLKEAEEKFPMPTVSQVIDRL